MTVHRTAQTHGPFTRMGLPAQLYAGALWHRPDCRSSERWCRHHWRLRIGIAGLHGVCAATDRIRGLSRRGSQFGCVLIRCGACLPTCGYPVGAARQQQRRIQPDPGKLLGGLPGRALAGCLDRSAKYCRDSGGSPAATNTGSRAVFIRFASYRPFWTGLVMPGWGRRPRSAKVAEVRSESMLQ